MKYEIKDGKIRQSIWIDAPYDTFKDAEEALKEGIQHNCAECCYEPNDCPDNGFNKE